MSQTQVNCPKCNTSIDVNQILASKLEKEVQLKFQSEVLEHREKYKDALTQLQAKELSLETQEEQFQQKLQQELASHLKAQAQELRFSIKEELQEEQSAQISLIQTELEEKSNQVRELNHTKAQIEQLKRQNGEMEEKIKLEAQQSLTQQLEASKEQIARTLSEQHELKYKEKEKQLSDLKQKLDEARRKAEQGSQQSQGEVQELAIEEWLTLHFPFDTIEEIKKGMRGADCIQTIHTREIQNCGTVYYESKRTKEFQKTWIEKFKADMREKGADVGVLVTEVLPKDLERMDY